MAASIVRQLLRQRKHILTISKVSNSQITPLRSFSIARCLASRLYTEKHEWVLFNGSSATVGISKHAQEQLGDIVYVEFPDVGTELEVEDVSGCLESVKAASEIYAPVAGTVSEVNSALEDTPNLVNKSPLDNGWLFKLDIEEANVDKEGLMDEQAYQEFVGSLDNE